MTPDKKEVIHEHIIGEISKLDIAGYLKQEIQDILRHLHYYKIDNIMQNIEALKEYLICLDKQNTDQIHELEYTKNDECEIGDHDIHYYVSQEGLKKV